MISTIMNESMRLSLEAVAPLCAAFEEPYEDRPGLGCGGEHY
jgi:hypothetical protein